jgi:photosystem II stability/assembly factor-like uncharacterized protein
VFFTPSGGELWRAQHVEPPLRPLFSLDMRHDTMGGFCAGADGALIRTDDGGTRWEPVNCGTARDLFSVRFFSDGVRGILAGDEMTLLFTVDGGSVWAPAAVRD